MEELLLYPYQSNETKVHNNNHQKENKASVEGAAIVTLQAYNALDLKELICYFQQQ